MKRKLLKTFLVAFALVTGSMGVKAETGDVTTNVDIDFSTGIVDNVVTGTAGTMSIGQNNNCPTEINTDGRLVLGNGTHTVSLSPTELAGKKDVVTVSFELAFGKLSGKSVGFSLKDESGTEIGNFSFKAYDNVLENTFGVENTDLYRDFNTVLWERNAAFTITLDYANRKITTYTKCYKQGANKAATENTHTVDMTNTNPLSQFVLTSNYNNIDRRCQFDNLKITTTEGEYSAVSADYTVKYVDESGNEIKSSDVRTGNVDNFIDLTDTDKEPITHEGTKYLYKSDDSKGKPITSEGTVITVTFRKPYTATFNINTIIGGESSSSTTQLVETDDYICSWSYTYPLYHIKDGIYYKADNTSTFGESGTFSNEETIEKTITYTADNNIVYFGEWENSSEGGTYYPVTSNEYAFSNGKGKAIMRTDYTMSQSFTVPEKAYYTLVMPYKNISNRERNHIISIDDNAEPQVTVPANGGTGEFNKEVLLDEGSHTVSVKCVYSLTSYFDYATVRKTADLATVSSVGFATYSPSSNVAVPENVNVYTVTVNDEQTRITLSPVQAGTVLEAGTGYVIEATEGNYPFAVSNEAVSEIGMNDLLVSQGDVTVAAGQRIYVLAVRQSNGSVGFTKVAEGVTIPAGKAYLLLTDNGKEAAPFLTFGNETTAVNGLENNRKANNTYYTLQGMKTTAPDKGLYILNGKKVVVK